MCVYIHTYIYKYTHTQLYKRTWMTRSDEEAMIMRKALKKKKRKKIKMEIQKYDLKILKFQNVTQCIQNLLRV